MANLFQMVEETEQCIRLQVSQGQLDRGLVVTMLQIGKEQTKGVSIRQHRLRTDILLLRQMIGKEALNQPGELGGGRAFHGEA
jgi:hypothetical protein